jgi:hypothetical protein
VGLLLSLLLLLPLLNVLLLPPDRISRAHRAARRQ